MSWKNSVLDAELYTYDYFFLEHVCRLCWCTDGILDLSSYNPKSQVKDATIAEKIFECIGIDVSTHTHPKKVCTKCLDEVEIFSEFRKFCQETDRKLHSILETGPSLHKEQPTESEDELLILKQETDEQISNLEIIANSIDELFNLPLSCEINANKDRPLKKERQKRSAYYCNFCHLNLETEENLTNHNLECHGIEIGGLYKCFGCEKRFKNIKKRLRHESETCKNLKSGYKCNICKRCLPKRRVYEHHMRAHRENKEINFADEIKCNKCKETFENIECLREHVLIHFPKEKKSYVCDACGRVFNRRDYLNKHKLTHSGNRQLKCPHCDYRALQKSTLNVHIRKHTGDRPYPCDLCPQRCVSSSNLRAHRKRHFGVKAYECKLCDKKFGYKLSLEEHMATTHERSESHVCNHCGVSYNRFRSLRHHLFAKHGKKVTKNKYHVVELQNGQNSQVVVENTQGGTENSQISTEDGPVSVENRQIREENDQISTKNYQMKIQTIKTIENSQNIENISQNSQASSQNIEVIVPNSENVLINKIDTLNSQINVCVSNSQISVLIDKSVF